MNCPEVISLIRDYVDHELAPQEMSQMKAHLDKCSSCTERLEEERYLKLSIRKWVKSDPAPAGLTNVIARQIRTQKKIQTSWLKRRTLIFVSLAGAFLLGGLSVWGWLSFSKDQAVSTPSEWTRELVNDHVRYLSVVNPAQHLASSAKEVEKISLSKVDFSLRLPEFTSEEMKLSGVRFCRLLDRRIALLFYERNGKRLSLFAMKDEGIDFSGMNLVDRLPCSCATKACSGYRVVAWRKNGFLYSLVFSEQQNDLLDLVRNTYQY